MKRILISNICISLLLTYFSIPSLATNNNPKSQSKAIEKLDAKCHVALINGNEAIVFWRTTPEKLAKLASDIIGNKASTPKLKDKVRIYRAYECVLEKEEFSTLKARTLDDKTPR